MRLETVLVTACMAALFPALGCSSKDEPEELADPDLPGVATNPDGVPYPTDHLGGQERRRGRAGDRIPNFTFRAYRKGRDGGKATLETVSLAEYYDPDARRHKVLHLQLAATWCGICSSEISATVPVAAALGEEGVAFVEVIVSGQTPGVGPSLAEVDGWVDRHGTPFPTAIDVRARRLGPLGVSGAVMPHDILIDTRTMEILDSSVGAPLDVAVYVRDGLRFVGQNPPSY